MSFLPILILPYIFSLLIYPCLKFTSDTCEHSLLSLGVYSGLKVHSFFFFKIFKFIFRDGGRGGERQGEKHQSVASCMPPPGAWPATQACALTGNRIGNLLVHRKMPNPLSHTSQGYFHINLYLASFKRNLRQLTLMCAWVYTSLWSKILNSVQRRHKGHLEDEARENIVPENPWCSQDC